MKKKLLSFLSIMMMSSGFVVNAQYCEGGPSNTADSNIEDITLNGVNATSINYTGCPGVTGVEDQTATTVDLVIGQEYTVDVTFGTCASSWAGAGEVWIDYNQDQVFDAVESIGQSAGTPGSAPWDAPVTFTFTIPQTATVGNTRIRFVQEEGGATPLDPCAAFSWGSVIDFTVNVIAQPATPPTPIQDPAAPSCSTGSDLTLAGTPPAGEEWYWQGTDEFGTLTADDGTAAYTVFTNGTYYARAYNPTLDAWSEASSVTVSNFVLPSDPPAPVADADPACELTGGTNLNVAAAPAGIEYYWQGTNMSGTSQAEPATAPYAATTSGTYYVAAYDPATECWSNTSSVTVSMSTEAPLDPVVDNTSISACASDVSILLEAQDTISTYTYTIDMFDSFGDGWSGNTVDIFIDGSLALTAGTGFTGGGNDSETFTVEAGQEVTTSVAGGGTFSGECSFDILDETGTVVGSGDDVTTAGPYVAPGEAGPITLNWYDAATGGNLLGSGNTLEAIGTSVMPTAANGTYEFYVEQSSVCSSNRVLVTVVVSAVNVELTATDESCINYADGEIAISNILCGTAPFQFSTDNGVNFSNDLTGLSEGSYDVIVQDDNGDLSSTYTVVVGLGGTQAPNNPDADSPIFYCSGETAMPIDVNETGLAPCSLTASASGQDDANTTAEITDFSCIDGMVNSVSLDAAFTGGFCGTWYDFDIIVNGTTVAAGQCNQTGFDLTPYLPLTSVQVVSNDIDAFSDAITIDIEVVVDQSFPDDYEWFDTPNNGNLLGNGVTLETIGTSVMPTAQAGTYSYFVSAVMDGCYSDSVEVVVEVSDVLVEITSTPTTCNGSATGSFEVTDTLCGVTPFTYSVDGGAFDAAIPTDLLPGTHTVIVEDDNGDQSASITFTVEDAEEPTGLVMEDITDNGGQVSWNANGNETQWNVEWGPAGYTPGTGNELGTDVVADTFAIITGLDSNEDYDFYVSANCGGANTPADSSMISFTTDCGIYGLPFVETFENDSETRVCWTNQYEDGTADWTYQQGSNTGAITTAYEGDLNARFVSVSGTNSPITKLVSPRFDFTGQDSVAVVFAHAEEIDAFFGDQNETKVYTIGSSAGSVWDEIASYNGPDGEWSVDTLFVADTTLQIAFEGINNWGFANVVDYVQFMPCNLTPGVDGEEDVCRLDGTFDLNSIITQGEDFGRWAFPQNPSVLNDSVVTVSALPEGTFEFYYIVETPCAADTTVATLNIFPPSSAGQNGTLNVCQNEPVNLFDGLSGNVDLGGTWYDPSDNPIAGSQPTSSSIPGSFNYDYITSNGVCPADTALVEVIVAADCDWLSIGEEKMDKISIFPNPATEVINISNPSNSESLKVEILDMNGRVVLTDAKALANATEGSINVSQLVKGMYTLRVYNEEGHKTFKVVIQ